MTGLKDDFGRTVHCRTLGTQKEYTGTLLITDKEITADLFAYEARYIEIDDEKPVHLQTQHLNVVSL